MLVEVRHAGVQRQKFFPSRFLAASLTSLLIPGGPVRLFDQIVAARRRDHLDVLRAVEHRKRSSSRPVTPELVRVNEVWDGMVDQEAFKEGLGRISVPVRL